MFAKARAKGFQIAFTSHAEAIISRDFKDAEPELDTALNEIQIPVMELVQGGGGEALVTQRLRNALARSGWRKHNFEIKKIIDGVERESRSHQIDHVKPFERGTLALELEWNNKDPFFDRDLENFKRLHAEGVISVGGIITRGPDLQNDLGSLFRDYANRENILTMRDLVNLGLSPTPRQQSAINRNSQNGLSFGEAWAKAFTADKFGSATTHWAKLRDRIARGVGNPCPLVLIGIPTGVILT